MGRCTAEAMANCSPRGTATARSNSSTHNRHMLSWIAGDSIEGLLRLSVFPQRSWRPVTIPLIQKCTAWPGLVPGETNYKISLWLADSRLPSIGTHHVLSLGCGTVYGGTRCWITLRTSTIRPVRKNCQENLVEGIRGPCLPIILPVQCDSQG